MSHEKDTFLNEWAREVQTTAKVLKAYPAGKEDLKPAELCKNARDLAFVFIAEQALANAAINGKMSFDSFPQVSGTVPEIIARYEAESTQTADKVRAMSDDDWNGMMDFMVGPGKMGQVRRADILWLVLHDKIHHRGQFSIYLRMAGGKVPSIYGPSHDEPWM